MLRETIADYEANRISETIFLSKVIDIMNNVLSHTDSNIPETLKGRDIARAFYGLCLESLSAKVSDDVVKIEISKNAAIRIDDLIQRAVLDGGTPIVDWQYKTNITGKLQIEIGDYLIDEVRDKYGISLSFGEMDEIASKCLEVAKIRYK